MKQLSDYCAMLEQSHAEMNAYQKDKAASVKQTMRSEVDRYYQPGAHGLAVHRIGQKRTQVTQRRGQRVLAPQHMPPARRDDVQTIARVEPGRGCRPGGQRLRQGRAAATADGIRGGSAEVDFDLAGRKRGIAT
eukprot:gene63563-86948_t